MIKVGIVGAGNRFENYNLPVIKALGGELDICGIVTKSGKLKKKNVKKHISAPVYTNVRSLATETNPELLWVSVPVGPCLQVLVECLKTGIPTLVETPIEFNMQSLLAIQKYVNDNKIKLGIIEQWPFLPYETFKKQVIKSGAIGDVIVVENDYRTYDYHGIAQLRNYLHNPGEIQKIDVQEHLYRLAKYIDTSGEIGTPNDHWKIITAKYQNGAQLINKYSSVYKKTHFRIAKGLRVYGTKGTIFAGCVEEDGEIQISVLDEDGQAHSLDIFVGKQGSIINEIYTTLPTGDTIRWENEYNLSEHQYGVATHLSSMITAIQGEGKVLYSIADMLKDLFTLHGVKN